MNKNTISRLFSVAALGTLAFTSEPAQAATKSSCTVQYAAIQNDHLMLKCVGDANEYNAIGPGWTACGSRVTAETFKIFGSMTQSALLSGKTLTFNHFTDGTCPAGVRIINYIRVNQ